MLLCNYVHILHHIFSVPVDTVGLEETGNKILNEDIVCSAFILLFMLLVSFMQPGARTFLSSFVPWFRGLSWEVERSPQRVRALSEASPSILGPSHSTEVCLLLKGATRKQHMCRGVLTEVCSARRPPRWTLPASLLPFSAETSRRVADRNRTRSSLSVRLWGSGSSLKCGLFNCSFPCS